MGTLQVTICPGGVPTGYSYYIPLEQYLESRITTKGYMESKVVALVAGRVGERILLGEDNISPAGAEDIMVLLLLQR